MTGDPVQHPNPTSADSFFASMRDAVVIFNDQGLIQEINDKALALLNYSRQQLLDAEITLILPYIDQYLDESLSDFFLQEDQSQYSSTLQYQVTAVNRDGRELSLELHLNIIPAEHHLIFCASMHPVSQEQARHANPAQNNLATIFEHAAIGMMILDLDQRIIDANPALSAMLQYRRDELSGMTFSDITHPEDAVQGVNLFKQLVAGQCNHYQLVKRYLRRDGAVAYCRITVSLLPGEAEQPLHVLSMIEDITDQKRAQEILENTQAELETRVRERTEELTAANRKLMLQIEKRMYTEKMLGDTESRLSVVVRNAPIIVFAVNSQGEITYADGKGLDLLALTREQLMGKTMLDFFAPEQAFHLSMSKVLAGQSVSRTIEVQEKVFDLWCAPSRELNGSINGVIGVMADITDRIRVQQKITASEKDLSTILNNMQDTFYRMDLEGTMLIVSPSIKSLLGFSQEELIGTKLSELYVDPTGSGQLPDLLQQNNGYINNYEIPLRRKDGSIIWVSTNAHWCQDATGNIIGIEGITRDITKTKRTAQRLYYLANYDALTELPNRTLFRDRLKHAMALAKRNQKMVALFFLDIDHFKDINDSLGHIAGDQLLQGVARRIKSCAREGDTVARMGGDEFTVILEGLQEDGDAEHVAVKIIDAMADPFAIEGHEIYVSPSIGIALYPTDGDTIDDLVRNADTAMYQAKGAGRNNFKFFSASMKTMAIENLMLQNNLRNAIDNRQFLMYYQPQLDLATGHMVGMEALIRWQHPEHGMIQPADFIPIAEQSGLITAIDKWVVYTVCQQLASWRAAGLAPVKIAVNLSSLQFQQPDFADNVLAILEQTGADPAYLEFEITESILISDVNQAVNTLEQLNEAGIQICVDDFGIGYSSLSYLKQFPLHTLKIDRSFIHEIGSGGNNDAVTEAIIGLGHSLKLKVVAEGVEREEQLSFLVPRGCDVVQGYLFSGPCTHNDIVEWMVPA